jgi:mannose-6-phosphate isomerase-like protein (cupin superfamily)
METEVMEAELVETKRMVQQKNNQQVSPAPRRIYNPAQKDYATFLETSASTNGKRTLLEVEVAPGGGNGLHYHTTYSERFEVLEGELGVQVGNKKMTLKPGESATVPINTLHRFYNVIDQPTRFLVELQPGSVGFEQGLQIAYGLATDGLTNKEGMPTNMYHLAVILELTETMVPGVFALVAPLFRYLAARARRKGIEQELIRKYCR